MCGLRHLSELTVSNGEYEWWISSQLLYIVVLMNMLRKTNWVELSLMR